MGYRSSPTVALKRYRVAAACCSLPSTLEDFAPAACGWILGKLNRGDSIQHSDSRPVPMSTVGYRAKAELD